MAMPAGLAGFLAARQQGTQEDTAALQQASQTIGLLSALQKQQSEAASKEALSLSGGDPEKAMQILLSKGNYHAAHEVAPLVKMQQDARAQALLAGGDMNDPEFLRRAGMALKRPEFITHAERIDAERAKEATLNTMKSAPAIPPDPQENAIAADQGTPPVATVLAKPGAFDTLTRSEIPAIAQAARNYQAQMNASSARSIPPQHWLDLQKQLTAQEATQLEMRARAADRANNEPLVAILKDGKSVYVPRSQAVGATPANAMNQGDVVNPDNAHLHGEEYIATLPPGMQNVVRGLIEYKLPLNQLSSRTGERKAAFEHAAQADPNFNVAKYQQRQRVMNDFTSGTTANNLTALDQALNHMGTLSQLATALQNNDIPAANAVVNYVRKQTGDPRVTNFATAQQAVATELMRVFRQVNASEAETKEWMAHFPVNGSPAQIQQALGTGAKLLEGRVNALNTRWNNGMDVETGYPKLMSPQAKQSLDSLLGRGGTSLPPKNARGWPLMQDAKGNQAYVGPNGQIEEVK